MAVSYIGLGSNIAPRHSFLHGAVDYLQHHSAVKVTACSSVYETSPVGYTEQADFLNMVIEVETSLGPDHLYVLCQEIEEHFNRERTVRWGPRTLDLDILLYNQENMKTNNLIIPHPRMHERAFVLIPLAEINPDIWIPSYGKSAGEMAKLTSEEDKQGVTKWKGSKPDQS